MLPRRHRSDRKPPGAPETSPDACPGRAPVHPSAAALGSSFLPPPLVKILFPEAAATDYVAVAGSKGVRRAQRASSMGIVNIPMHIWIV